MLRIDDQQFIKKRYNKKDESRSLVEELKKDQEEINNTCIKELIQKRKGQKQKKGLSKEEQQFIKNHYNKRRCKLKFKLKIKTDKKKLIKDKKRIMIVQRKPSKN